MVLKLKELTLEWLYPIPANFLQELYAWVVLPIMVKNRNNPLVPTNVDAQ
jgi:hypothetical protein